MQSAAHWKLEATSTKSNSTQRYFCCVLVNPADPALAMLKELADVEGEVWPDQQSERIRHLEEMAGLKTRLQVPKAVVASGCRVRMVQ